MKGPFLIIDLEATCWEDNKKEKYERQNEIIEIGMTIVSAENELLWRGGWYVKPLVNPVLSDFCKQLTSIQQSNVDQALALPAVLAELSALVTTHTGKTLTDCLFVSWGDYDRSQFEKDCRRHQIPYPFGPHMNIKQYFNKKYRPKRGGLLAALAHFGMEFEGVHHRGADDAYNIARIFMKEFEFLSAL